MKTLRLTVLAIMFVLFSFTGKAQWVSIPDTNFANYLRTNWGMASCVIGSNATGWQMDTTCPAVTSLKWIQCNGLNIWNIQGVQYFDSLERLECFDNELNYLPYLPPMLQYLDCSNQTSSNFGFSFHVPPLPATLTELYCSNNQINLLQNLPLGLTGLHCQGNWLTSLPTLPASLLQLSCQRNNLTSLPSLPPLLKQLSFSSNSISTLGSLPTTLQQLGCDSTMLSVLPALPDSLQVLSAQYTPIAVIPPLPKSLTYLNLSFCYNLISLPELSDSLFVLKLNNTALTCLPQLKKVRYLTYANSSITCLPNYPLGNTFSNPALGTVPLCDYFNPGGCAVYWNISGKVYIDANNNCTLDTGELDIINMPVQLWQNGNLLQQDVNHAVGVYSFNTTAFATYQLTIDTANSPFRIKCPAGGSLTSVISAADSVDGSMDFALECKPGFDLEARSVIAMSFFRPANFTTVEVAAGDASNFYGAHCATGVTGTVTLSFTGPAKFISAAPNALTPNVTGNTLTYNIADFGAVNFFEDFDVVVQTDTTAQAGQQVCFTLNVTPTNGDNNTANNTFSICYTVVNSFDPNDKQVSPSGNIDTAQRELVYTIRFQNTGNAEAQHIYITDTLSSSINPASFQLLAYSHQPMVQLDGNRLRFNFPNINLPDSTTNEPASHGYVQFKVKLNNGLPVGTVINNTAFIYFDFNAPVVTNTTTNTIYVPAPPAIKPISIGKYRIDRAVKPNGRL